MHALLTINAVARVNIAVLPRAALYAVILPALYAETAVKEGLKREVDFAACQLIVDGAWHSRFIRRRRGLGQCGRER
jgi:hypothetical protein